MFLIIVGSDDLNCGGQWRCTAESAPSLLDCYNQGYMFPQLACTALEALHVHVLGFYM